MSINGQRRDDDTRNVVSPPGFVCTYPDCCKGNTKEPCEPWWNHQCWGPSDEALKAEKDADHMRSSG
jgi:hypothetical protein